MPVKTGVGCRAIDCLKEAQKRLDEHKVPSKGRVSGNLMPLTHYVAKVEICGKTWTYYVYARNKEEAETAFLSLIHDRKG